MAAVTVAVTVAAVMAVAATVTVAAVAVVGAREAGFRPQRQYPLLL